MERKMSMAERQQAARACVCPQCHSAAGKPCRKNRQPIGRSGIVMPGTAMKGIHLARLKMMSKFSGNRVDTAR